MLIIRSRLIIGIISKIISAIFKGIYKILSIFSLQWTLLLAIAGVILYFTGVLTDVMTVRVIYFLLLVCSLFYSIIATVCKLLGIGKKKKNAVQIIKDDNKKTEEEFGLPEDDGVLQRKLVEKEPVKMESGLIGYFKVKQNPNYVMAEYTDRYELYYMTAGGLKKVRTDYKN